MNKLLTFFLLLTLGFVGCSKDNDDSNGSSNTPVTTFKFTVNGTPYEVTGSLLENTVKGAKIERDPWHNTFALYAHEVVQNTTKFYAHIPLPNPLVTGTFNFTYPSNGSFDSEVSVISIPVMYYQVLKTGDAITVNITKVENGYASGTFSASKLSGTNTTPPTIQITNGEFTNVKIIQ